MKLKLVLALMVLSPLLGIHPSTACSVFSFTAKAGSRFLAKNFDGEPGSLVLKQNPANLNKFSNGKTWISHYETFTVSLKGASSESVVGGINSAGLMLEILECPPFDTKSSSTDWIQYHLDQFSSVEGVVRSLDALTAKLDTTESARFMGCDPSECFFAEIKQGKLQYSRRGDFSPDVMADLLHDPAPVPSSIRAPSGEMSPDQALEQLGKLQSGSTQWSIVYDIANRGVTFKTKDMASAKSFSLTDNSKAIAVQVLFSSAQK